MMTMHVVPASGREVPDPELGGLLAAEGREVPKTQYWMRRLADDDVVQQPARGKAARSDQSKEA